jgi:hypothetical protein
MTGLAELQKKFQDYVLRPQPGMDEEVVGSDSASAATRLAIYADAYRLRLIEALATDYSAVKTLAGEAEFDYLARAYIDSHPSTYYNVRWFGGSFPDFLRKAKRLELSEMAQFEWAMTLAFDSADEPQLSIEQVAAVPAKAWPEMTFVPHSSLQRLRLQFNVPEKWKAIASGEDVPNFVKNAADWVIWRRNYKTYFRSLEIDESAALRTLCAGGTFGAICEQLTESIPGDEVGVRAASLLKGWVADGLLHDVSVAA